MRQPEAVDTMDDPSAWPIWTTFAAGDSTPDGKVTRLRHFGPLDYARLDGSADRVVRVLLSETDDPGPDDSWAWLDRGATMPSCIGETEQVMTDRFVLGENVPGPHEEQELEQGRILRLRVTVLEEVYRRGARERWIPSAL